jgi:predicted transcriptional regulator with HTH domain
MQSDNLNSFSRDNRRPLVIRSLRRSNIRKKIADYLFEICPNGSYTSEIAYNIKTTPTNVIGAIRGMGSRYKAEESLISLEVVEKIENNSNLKLYKLTDFGKEIVESLKIK